MDGIEQHICDVSTGRVEFCDLGSGWPILYFHGTGAGNEAVVLLEQKLITSGCRLIVPNRPGYFNTSLGDRGSAVNCAQLGAELLDHLQIRSVAVIGTSGGGMPAAAFARRYPARTTALILQCAQSHRWDEPCWLPRGIGRGLFLFRHRCCYPLLRWYNRFHARSLKRNPLACLQSMSGSAADQLACVPEVMIAMEVLTQMMDACAARPQGIENDWRILVGHNGIAPRSIHCPTLIIHGRDDPLVPYSHAEWSHSSIRNSQLLEVQGSGHLVWYGSDSEIMHRRRMEFLNTHAMSGAR